MKPLGRGLALCAATLLLGACAGHRPRHADGAAAQREESAAPARRAPETSLPQDRRYAQAQDGEPDRKIDVATLPEPTPVDEPRSKYGNRSPYTVLGESYRVLPSSAGYVERGIASWYGNKFHGYMTSSFEPYDMYQFSAAHKTLPLPSWVRVTNLANGKSVVVRVNDRGPFHKDRLIDLSYAAAARIGIWPAGTGRVEVRAIGPHDAMPTARIAAATNQSPARAPAAPAPLVAAPLAAAAPALAPSAPVYVQVGSYGDPANARRVAAALRRAGLGEVQVVDATVTGRRVTRVRLGPFPDVAEANRRAEDVRRRGLGDARVASE